MKMCLRVKKYMLVTGSAMETLVYISASNLSNVSIENKTSLELTFT